jgi:hypothetical protein
MKREKKLTKRERKELTGGPRTSGAPAKQGQHIHCISCGRHLDEAEFSGHATARMLRCEHGSTFPSCVACEPRSTALIAEHDRTGQSVQTAGAWH